MQPLLRTIVIAGAGFSGTVLAANLLRRSREPLLKSLVSTGLAVPDSLGLGFRTGRYGALMDSEGWPGLHLYYLGPMLRADHWEATGATELRGHAERLAAHLVTQTDDEPRDG